MAEILTTRTCGVIVTVHAAARVVQTAINFRAASSEIARGLMAVADRPAFVIVSAIGPTHGENFL